jgi:hypothetical protein
MKLGKVFIADASIALLVIQLMIVSTVAAKYLYQRWTLPRVWTRTTAFDPDMLLRGRYASLQLLVDGCRSTLPSAEQAEAPRDKDGAPTGQTYTIHSEQPVQFSAQLKVEENRLLAIRIADADTQPGTHAGAQLVTALPGSTCAQMRLNTPLDFFMGEHAANPQTIHPGQELWIEVSVPSNGPPRPIQLALKDHGAWKPLAYQ